jgi:hypothetical protein
MVWYLKVCVIEGQPICGRSWSGTLNRIGFLWPFLTASSYAFFGFLCALITLSEEVRVTHWPLNFSSIAERSVGCIVELLYHFTDQVQSPVSSHHGFGTLGKTRSCGGVWWSMSFSGWSMRSREPKKRVYVTLIHTTTNRTHRLGSLPWLFV